MGKFDIETREFLRQIIEDANCGRTFVPFIGSGLSSPSGIIMGMEFTNYLAFTAYLVLCEPQSRTQTHGEGRTDRWNLSVQGWPPLPSSSEVEKAKEWILQQFMEICKDLDLRRNFDNEGKIQSLVRDNKTPLDDFVLAMTQPPIPMILRSWAAAEDEEQLRQLRGLLTNGPAKRSGFLSQTWKRSDQSFHDVVVESGIRALSDWRETLEFLCRVQIEDHETKGLCLGEPNPSVIDDFNTTITRDKRPSLGHKILAHLSEPLRICTLLTTNFDTLTEDAYRALSLPLTVLPVSARGDLPNPRTASSCDALIKLHGESHDTRADLSLDEEPSTEDKATFLAYMQRGNGHLLHKPPQRRTSPNRTSRLLVVGYSGNDHRCVQMIKHWLEHSSDAPKVYWICFSESDQRKVERLFSSTSFADRIRSVLTSRPDLLLYELYQRLQLSLPPGGLTYEFSHVLPPQRTQPYDHDEAQVVSVLNESISPASASDLVANYTRRMLRDATVMACCESTVGAITTDDSPSRKSVLVSDCNWTPEYRFDMSNSSEATLVDAAKQELKSQPVVLNSSGGVVRASALAATRLTRDFNKKVFWIELQDYPDVDSLLRDLLRSLALRCGQFQAKHVTLHPISGGFNDSDDCTETESFLVRIVSHIRSVLEEYRTDPSSVVIFLSGRDSYGCASGLVCSPWTDESEFRRLHVFIEALGRIGIPCVYFPCTKARSDRKLRLIGSTQVVGGLAETEAGVAPQVAPLTESWPWDKVAEKMVASRGGNPVEEIANDLSVFSDILKDALSDFFEINQYDSGQLTLTLKEDLPPASFKKMEFLYALTVFRHSRHANAIAAEGAFSCPYRFQDRAVDNDFVRSLQVDRWTTELCEARVFFKKPGGALWMHRDIREAIQSALERVDIAQVSALKRRHSCFRETRGRTHFWIGEWYHKAFCSSGHLTPILEAVYHLVSSAVYSQFAKPKLASGETLDAGDLESYQCMMFESAVAQASKTLLLSWRFIELWQASSANVAWLGAGHRDRIENALTGVMEEIDKTQEYREKLKSSVEQFLMIHGALHDAVVLEGGRSERGATSWSTPESIVMRLVDQGDKSSPSALPHGIDAIRKKGRKFWQQLEEPLDEDGKKLWEVLRSVAHGNSDTTQFGKAKAAWKAAASTPQMQNMIWFLGEAAYVLLRRAKLKFHASGAVDNESWLISTLCCNLGIDLCKHLPAWNLAYEMNSKIKIHSIYAVGLANLGRFYEANRHLNEAQGLLSKWQHGTSEDYAVISIRRAEVKLTECYWISCLLDPKVKVSQEGIIEVPGRHKFSTPAIRMGAARCWELTHLDEALVDSNKENKLMPPKLFEAFRSSRPVGFDPNDSDACDSWINRAQSNLKNLYSATLDEAVRSLETAEKNMGGASQSSLWWSRLHTLRMRVYGLLNFLPEDAELCIVFRKQSADNGIFKNFLSAKRIAGEDDFRRLRALKYFLRANRWYCRYRAPELFTPEGNPLDNDLKIFERFLPDSIKAANKLADDLWSDNKVMSKTDLLKLAIERCFDEYREIDPR